jgi:hypothetical protein
MRALALTRRFAAPSPGGHSCPIYEGLAGWYAGFSYMLQTVTSFRMCGIFPAFARRGDCAEGAVGAVGQRRKYLVDSVRFAEIYNDAARLWTNRPACAYGARLPRLRQGGEFATPSILFHLTGFC